MFDGTGDVVWHDVRLLVKSLEEFLEQNSVMSQTMRALERLREDVTSGSFLFTTSGNNIGK